MQSNQFLIVDGDTGHHPGGNLAYSARPAMTPSRPSILVVATGPSAARHPSAHPLVAGRTGKTSGRRDLPTENGRQRPPRAGRGARARPRSRAARRDDARRSRRFPRSATRCARKDAVRLAAHRDADRARASRRPWGPAHAPAPTTTSSSPSARRCWCRRCSACSPISRATIGAVNAAAPSTPPPSPAARPGAPTPSSLRPAPAAPAAAPCRGDAGWWPWAWRWPWLGAPHQRIGARRVQRRGAPVNGQPDFELRAQREGFDEALFARVATQPGVALASAVIELDAQALDAAGQPVPLRVIGLDALAAAALTPALLPRPPRR